VGLIKKGVIGLWRLVTLSSFQGKLAKKGSNDG